MVALRYRMENLQQCEKLPSNKNRYVRSLHPANKTRRAAGRHGGCPVNGWGVAGSGLGDGTTTPQHDGGAITSHTDFAYWTSEDHAIFVFAYCYYLLVPVLHLMIVLVLRYLLNKPCGRF